ncbi:hypothetical protein QBC47DRAFT_389454 [Echria macrotheca]|uniref:Efficient mitochondria targeting-associated protein 19 n=1 Tax=Echria macrotheca TaxID=438768 RepID=A0AAJ0B784_9PEZI|nr:hypothetical protein QBC47DRAFT_389454 [Echria macrotheca]
MTQYNRSFKNHIWLVWALLQLPIILFIDGLDFLPPSLYLPATSPLHVFHALKADYIAQHNDPIAQWSPATAAGHDSWMGLFVYAELVLSLPILLFTVYRLCVQRRGTSGAHELALLVYAFETAFTTLTCIHDTLYWDPQVYSVEARKTLVVNMYSPWLIVPSIMFIDMASRILGRIRVADAAVETKKTN